MFIERRIMKSHLLGGKGTLIFLVKYVEYILAEDKYSTQLGATPELNVSRGAIKTFQFF